MNILFYTSVPAASFGGPVNWTRQLIDALQDSGHHVHMLTWGQVPANRLGWGTSFQCVPLNARVARVPLVGFWHTMLTATRACRQFIQAQDIHVIHTLGVYETFGASLARKSSDIIALIMTIHGDYVTEHNRWWKSRWRRRLYLPLERLALRQCDAITTSSAWLGRKLASQFRNTRTEVIPNGITAPLAGTPWPDRQTLNLPPDKKIILTLNNLFSPHRRRGLELLIAAAPAILDRVPNVCFLVVGGVNDLTKDHKLVEWARARATGLPFTFTGFRQQPPYDLMMAADVYVHPSFLDNSPLSVMEAMSLAKPIVATQVGGIPEIIDDGVTGLLVPLNSDALADAIVYLLQNSAHAQALGRQAREKALSAFTWPRVAERFTELYQGAVHHRRKGGP